jgi:hypothetical protein
MDVSGERLIRLNQSAACLSSPTCSHRDWISALSHHPVYVCLTVWSWDMHGRQIYTQSEQKFNKSYGGVTKLRVHCATAVYRDSVSEWVNWRYCKVENCCGLAQTFNQGMSCCRCGGASETTLFYCVVAIPFQQMMGFAFHIASLYLFGHESLDFLPYFFARSL